MPVKVQKITEGKHKGRFRVVHDGKVSAKATSKENAESQARLLRAVKHGFKLRGN